MSKSKLVEAFLNEKSSMEQKITDLNNQIIEIKMLNEQNIQLLEKQFLVDKNKLKNQMIEKLNEIANEFRKALYEKIDNTTKKVIGENFLLNTQIKKIAKRIEKLLKENESLKEAVIFSINLSQIFSYKSSLRILILRSKKFNSANKLVKTIFNSIFLLQSAVVLSILKRERDRTTIV